jgi:hypothetical protein
VANTLAYYSTVENTAIKSFLFRPLVFKQRVISINEAGLFNNGSCLVDALDVTKLLIIIAMNLCLAA